MPAAQAPKRRPVTYGKRTQSRGFGYGLDALIDDNPLPPAPSRLSMPSAASSKLRKVTSTQASSSEENKQAFDVESSEDELRLPSSSHPQSSPDPPPRPPPSQAYGRRYEARPFTQRRTSPAKSESRGASGAKKRKRVVKPLTSKPRATPLSPSSSDLAGEFDSSNHPTPQAPMTPTPEPSQPTSSSPGTQAKVSATTPKQSQLWKNLLEDSESDTTPATKLQRLRLQSTAKKPKATSEAPSLPDPPPVSRRLVDGLQRPDDSSEITMDDRSVVATEDAVSVREDSEMVDDPPAPLSQQSASHSRPRITYGPQRSYLQNESSSLEEMLAQPLDDYHSPKPVGVGVSDASHAAKAGSSAFDFLDDADEEPPSQIKNIHELRAAGDTRRFHDETNNLMDDLDPRGGLSVSGRRSTYLMLATKLEDAQYRSRFTQSSYEAQLFARSKNEEDVICLGGVAAAAFYLLQSPAEPQCVSHALDDHLEMVLERAMARNQDLAAAARGRQMNMSKSAQRSVAEFKTKLATSILSVDGPTTANISPQRIALRSLECLVRRARECGRKDALLSPSLLDLLLKISDAPQLPRSSEHDGGWKDAETVLSILESATVSAACAWDENLFSVARLAQITMQLQAVLRGSACEWEPLRPLALRLCLNLANNNERNSDEFAEQGFVGALLGSIREAFQRVPELVATMEEGEREATQQFDNLLLSLGAMINLAELSRRVRQSVERDGRSIFDALVKTFAAGREQTVAAESIAAASRAAVAHGYLAILLANLALHPRLRARTAAQLPQGHVNMLVEAVEEFILHHREADRKQQDSSEWADFTGRLQGVADALREVTAVPGAHGGCNGVGG